MTFERVWRLGRATFRPPGELSAEVAAFASQTEIHKSWAIAYESAADVAARWAGSSTIEVAAPSADEALAVLSESLAALRFFMREIVSVNVDVHRIGLVGEVDHAVREYVGFFDGRNRVAAGWKLIDAAVEFRFSAEDLAKWDEDPRILWLSEQLVIDRDSRSSSGRRVVTSLELLDRAFLSREPVVRIILCAVAVEALLSDVHDPDVATPSMTGSLRIAARVAYLTCGVGCAVDRPACPYVLGFKGHGQVWKMAEEWASAGQEWRCSAFLNIARPPDMDGYFRRRSLFGARNEAAHEGRTTLPESDVGWMRIHAEEAVRAFLLWVSSKVDATVADLDAEIESGVRRLGKVAPADM